MRSAAASKRLLVELGQIYSETMRKRRQFSLSTPCCRRHSTTLSWSMLVVSMAAILCSGKDDYTWILAHGATSCTKGWYFASALCRTPSSLKVVNWSSECSNWQGACRAVDIMTLEGLEDALGVECVSHLNPTKDRAIPQTRPYAFCLCVQRQDYDFVISLCRKGVECPREDDFPCMSPHMIPPPSLDASCLLILSRSTRLSRSTSRRNCTALL